MAAPRPKLDDAELMPEVEMIQVEMLGTVNIQIAPMIKTMITVPNDRMPLLANQAIFSVDGTVVATHSFNYAEQVRPLFSDNNLDGVPLSVDWLRVTPYAASGTFTSRVYDAGIAKNWGAVTYALSGSTIALSARTGDTAAPDGS